ncbi:fimbria/pilus chaperone family protein [Achromobacter xylosoxidans]|uniref:fimbria/pilus chaperone family protein n=1 Tax=Alcaligenes xylosoxydans xylosoxydans TaxID=85698 RepID=UPI0022B8B6AB|nr:fimbria/pilus chaperone family protein [Achromobacter xylosoxidans]MCZ8392143.1 fimbria/pilus chaperone family protein [Achromobacter xylosoxidans]
MKPFLTCIPLACALLANPAGAAGVVPESSVLIVDEATGEGTMIVQNTDAAPVLLYTTIENVAEDPEEMVVATPPMARLEAGQSQLVRFMLTKKGPLATQRFKRVAFEGIPFARGADNQVQTTFRQNIPMIIQPRALEKLKDPWTRLSSSVDGDKLRLCNDSGYVVRLAQQARLDSANVNLPLPKTYLLPGERFELPLAGKRAATAGTVTIWPATVYGYAAGSYAIPLSNGCSQTPAK